MIFNMKKRLLTFLIASVIATSASFSVAPVVFAESSIEFQISDLSREAMEEYDFFEFDKASAKLKEAIKLIESNGVVNRQAAQVYVNLGIVEYAQFKDTMLNIAEKRASEDFMKAVALDSTVSIPTDYKSAELDELLTRAKDIIGPTGSASTVTIKPPENYVPGETSASESTPERPVIYHAPVTTSLPCKPLTLFATVPKHQDAARVAIRYKTDPNSPLYYSITMTPDPNETVDLDRVYATIPETETQASALMYYIEVSNKQNLVVATSTDTTNPHVVKMFGTCEAEKDNSPNADSIVQLAFLLGTGFAYFHGFTELCINNETCRSGSKVPGILGPGIIHMRLSIRADLMFNLPYGIQLGGYFRYTLVDPQQLAMMAGGSFRYLFRHKEKFKLYLGVSLGWGSAGTTYTYSDFKTDKNEPLTDILRVGSNSHIHIMPQFGFLYMPHKNAGIAFDISAPIHINTKDPEPVESFGETFHPPKVSANVDFQLGPVFRF